MRFFTRNLQVLAVLVLFSGCQPQKTMGPLTVSNVNPRYFTIDGMKAVYLTGSHTWNNLLDMRSEEDTATFDYGAFLSYLEEYHHNFFRLWAWDLLNWNNSNNRVENSQIMLIYPQPWLRTGPGLALDGKYRFDLSSFNPEYFLRLEARIREAQARNLYVAVMLFEGWGTQFSPRAYENHPFHPSNNIQDLPLATADSAKLEIYTLAHPEITRLQEAYVLKVIETVNQYDNVLYEISNENHPGSTSWQYHMIRFIREAESELGRTHPVGMTFQFKGGSNQALFNSPADWVSPNPEGGFKEDPPDLKSGKVIISDTDHLWGIGGHREWVWKSFFRGLNPIFMDPYQGKVLDRGYGSEWAEEIRVAMGYSRILADKVDLLHMAPCGELASSGYCLANPGKEYLVYLPENKTVVLDLRGVPGKFRAYWFNALDGNELPGEKIQGDNILSLVSPFENGEAVVHIRQ